MQRSKVQRSNAGWPRVPDWTANSRLPGLLFLSSLCVMIGTHLTLVNNIGHDAKKKSNTRSSRQYAYSLPASPTNDSNKLLMGIDDH
jgi:hypothetical protein